MTFEQTRLFVLKALMNRTPWAGWMDKYHTGDTVPFSEELVDYARSLNYVQGDIIYWAGGRFQIVETCPCERIVNTRLL